MSKIKILAIPSDTYGVGKFRILNPYSYIQENYSDDFHIDINLNVPDEDEIFRNYDMVIYHSFIHSSAPFERNLYRLQWLKKNGIITIIDNDDFWETDFRHPLHQQIIKTNAHKQRIQLIKNSDYVTVTTPIFKKTIKEKLGLTNVYVFPNAIDENEQQYKPNLIPSDKIRFGWLGGSSHLYDLEILKNGVNYIYNSSPNNTQFVLCGFDLRGYVNEIDRQTNQIKQREIRPEETTWYRYEKIFTNDYQAVDENYKKFLQSFRQTEYNDVHLPYRRRWTLPITSYATNYNHFDVSLAPLVPSTFNANKSQLKVIEAGFFKKALIASETEPYTLDLVNAFDNGNFNDKGNCILINPKRDHKDWGKYMKKLVDNPSLIENIGNRLYETVHEKYSMKKVSESRVQFLKTIKK